LKLLPSEPTTPNAEGVARAYYKLGDLDDGRFEFLLPFIIYDLAIPEAGKLPQCYKPYSRDLNKFEELFANTREYIESQRVKKEDTAECKDIPIQRIFKIAHDEENFDAIAMPSKKYLFGYDAVTNVEVYVGF
jgi:hypothetical protein